MTGNVILMLISTLIVCEIGKDIYDAIRKNGKEEEKWRRLIRISTIK